MTNTEKLKNLMREYGIEKCYYSRGMNLDEKKPNGEIILVGEKSNELESRAYFIFTDDGWVDEDQMLIIRTLIEGSKSFGIHHSDDMEVLYSAI